MKTVTGDLITLALEGEFDVIIHGCNCYNTMGAGIARAVRDRLPEAFAADRATIKGDFEKLGTYTSAEMVRDDVRFTVINAYTQGNYRGSGALVDYDAIRSNFRAVAKNFPDARIGYPKIGAGLAGGDWDRIAAIIDEELEGCDHTLVVLPRPAGRAGHSSLATKPPPEAGLVVGDSTVVSHQLDSRLIGVET